MYFLPLKRFILFLPEANFLNMIFSLLPIVGQRARASGVDVLVQQSKSRSRDGLLSPASRFAALQKLGAFALRGF
jgi:hypothetical protein